MLQKREEICSFNLFTLGNKSDEFFLQEQMVCITLFTPALPGANCMATDIGSYSESS